MNNWFLLTLFVAGFLSACSSENQAPVPSSVPNSAPTQTQKISQANAALQKLQKEVASRQQSKSERLSSEPQFMCAGSITHKQRVHIPPVAKPPFKKFYKDPAFGSRIIRITNSQFGEVYKPPYSTMQAWNADESLLLIYKSGKGGGHLLLNGHTYEPVQKLDILPGDIEEVFWSHTDPESFFYVSKLKEDFGVFKKYNVKSRRASVITDFRKQCGAKGLPLAGGDIHMQSLDDDLFGFRCRNDEGQHLMLSYRISTDETISKPIGKGTQWEDRLAPTPAPSGKRFFYQGKVLGLDLETVERSLDIKKFWEHSNVGVTHDGDDAFYSTAYAPSPQGCGGDLWQGVGHLIEHNLETGSCTPIINQEQGYPYTTSSTHVSSQAYRRPGWIAMSSIGKEEQLDFFGNGRKAPPLFSEIYLADTHPANRVTCRLAHHRSFGKMATKGDYPPYFGEPHATISPSGTRIIFGSDWYDSGSVDSYVIELPGYVRPR